ncbi:IGHMBP2 family helicase [Thermosipho atlanticus]|uniref:DNA helicase, putative n=1 Tax=Thermosipho atlanticus DSM 15807 TaxID=1123380 RepID=A0A1M5RRN7_9BACT|nr:IGHMBP2 family helicase [Thermosipho atlanticus]SHH28916.1 DNA helicase, putative [Thermosipho atlanticus DSM 15807]
MKGYIKKLVQLVEYERDEEIKKMIWEIKHLSGEQREKRGRAILNLRPKVIGEELGMYLVKFGRSRLIETEIGVGDEVIISKGDPIKSDLKGVVVEIGARYLIVSMDNLLPKDFKNVRIDLYVSDVTYKRQIENLKNLSERGKLVLEFLLGNKKLDDDKAEKIELFDCDLNESQLRAVSKSLSSTTFFLVHGPFGTGKTRTLVEYIVQEVKKGRKVLVTADSNMAVDNLVERLNEKVSHVRIGHPSRVSKKLQSSTLAFKIEHHEMYEKIKELKNKFEQLIAQRERFQKPIPKWRRGLSEEQILKLSENGKSARGIPKWVIDNMAKWIRLNRQIDELKSRIKIIEERIAKDIIENSNVVFSTNSSAFLEILNDFTFDVAVVDEATQATIPSVLIPLSKSTKFVLAGDHKQLPPTVVSERAKELSETLFEKLIKKYSFKSELLRIQYRMNEKLMEFPNKEFYDGKLVSAVGNITLSDLGFYGNNKITDANNVLIFIDTFKKKNRYESRKSDSTSYFNSLEAKIIKNVVKDFIKLGAKKEWIGVITPYDDQVDLLKSMELAVEINTVDGFQGKEKEIIIISFVRSNKKGEIGFLSDLRRLNVSLTRVKRKLICIGDSSTLKKHPVYKRFIEFVKVKGTYITFK